MKTTDPGKLAASVVAALRPLLQAAAQGRADESATLRVDALQRMLARSDARDALEDMLRNPQDSDAQAVLRVHLRKSLGKDQALAAQLQRWLGKAEARDSADAPLTASTFVQSIGDGNSIVRGHAHLQLMRYPRSQVRSDLDWLSPYTRSTKLIGREREMQSQQTLLEDPRPILARVITGGGGRGKTRLALELCEWASAHGWDAGFAGHSEMSRFLAQKDLLPWGWRLPTLVVIDYAARHVRALAPWIEELATLPRAPSHPLRLLLLERNASMQTGWCATVFASGGPGAARKRALLDPPEPVELAPLQSDESCLALIKDLLQKVAPGRPGGLSRERALLQQLRSNDWSGDPLYLMMAALSSKHPGRARALGLHRADLAVDLARREGDRIRELAGAQGIDARLAIHLASCVTLVQGMERSTFEAFAADELVAAGRRSDAADSAALADLLLQALPATHGVPPVLPDLIGEAFILVNMECEAVLRMYARHGMAVIQTAIRCAQDFSPRRSEPLQWLETIQERIADDEEELAVMAEILPAESVALADLSLRVAQRLAVLRSRDDVPQEQRAATLAHLAVACANAGQPEQALEAAQEAAELYRRLAAQHPDMFRPSLAKSLNNLAIMLSALDEHQPALQAAQEAAGVFRELAAQRHDVFRPALAMSLNTLTKMLSAMDQPAPALQSAHEATDLYQELAGQRPDVFGPALAGSLNNLAIMLSELGQPQAALHAAQRAAALYRELAAQRPDRFRPALAGSLNTLANMLSDQGEREDALRAAQEAVALHQELATQRPDMFRAALAGALNTLATMLSDHEEHEEAVRAAQEAVALYRELAAQRPDVTRSAAQPSSALARGMSELGQRELVLQAAREVAVPHRGRASRIPDMFRIDLAASLGNLATLLSEQRQHEGALQAAQESVALYRDLTAQRPEALRPELARSLGNLATRLSDLGLSDPALRAAQESVDLYRQLSDARPELFGPDLARSLNMLAGMLVALGHREPALRAAQESVDLRTRSKNDLKADLQSAAEKPRRPLRDRKGYVPPARRNKVMMTTFATEALRERFNHIASVSGLTAQELLRHLIEGVVRKADADPSFLAALAEETRAAKISAEEQAGKARDAAQLSIGQAVLKKVL